MVQVALMLALLLAGVLALFGAQNTEAVTLHFLWFSASAMPLSVAILGAALLGPLLRALVGLPGRVQRPRREGGLPRQAPRRAAPLAKPPDSAATPPVEPPPSDTPVPPDPT